jgi:hypothetical protein
VDFDETLRSLSEGLFCDDGISDGLAAVAAWAILHGEKIDNPADGVAPAPSETGALRFNSTF